MQQADLLAVLDPERVEIRFHSGHLGAALVEHSFTLGQPRAQRLQVVVRFSGPTSVLTSQ